MFPYATVLYKPLTGNEFGWEEPNAEVLGTYTSLGEKCSLTTVRQKWLAR